MSIIGSLLGRSTILTYEILFDDQDKVSVKVNVQTSPVKQEYIRLFGTYFTKIVYNFGGPSNQSSQIMIGFLQQIVEKSISSTLNCFEAVDVDDVIKYSDSLSTIVNIISGDFYGWPKGNRSITTNFPQNITEQQTVFGMLGLLQFAINENKEDQNNLSILQETSEGILSLYYSGLGESMSDITAISDGAFFSATQR